MPRISKIPKSISDYITETQFEMIFPYSKASNVFTHDNEPFWRYQDFIAAVKYMNSLPNKIFHNFGTDSQDDTTNLLEIACFLANFHQETGDPSIEAPYPWSWPKVEKTGTYYEGPAGGALAIMEGSIAQPVLGELPTQGELQSKSIQLSVIEKSVIKTPENTIKGIIATLNGINQPQFGLGVGTGNGVVFQPGLLGVSDDGTLWGDEPINEIVGKVLPTKNYKLSTTDRKYAALGPYAQYGGKWFP